ncbi:MAG: hypothetical protein V2A34_00535, partial [Lentisphaerota bacterium]
MSIRNWIWIVGVSVAAVLPARALEPVASLAVSTPLLLSGGVGLRSGNAAQEGLRPGVFAEAGVGGG